MKIQYANKFVEKLWMDDLTTCVYQFIYNEKDSVYTEILQKISYMDWDYVSR